MKVEVIGYIDLSKFEPKKQTVSDGAKQFLKAAKRSHRIRMQINKAWGGFINNRTPIDGKYA